MTSGRPGRRSAVGFQRRPRPLPSEVGVLPVHTCRVLALLGRIPASTTVGCRHLRAASRIPYSPHRRRHLWGRWSTTYQLPIVTHRLSEPSLCWLSRIPRVIVVCRLVPRNISYRTVLLYLNLAVLTRWYFHLCNKQVQNYGRVRLIFFRSTNLNSKMGMSMG